MTETIRIICGPEDGTSHRDVYPVTEVARRLGVSKRHVWRLARKRGFEIEYVSNVSCIDAEAIHAYEIERVTS